MSNDLVATDQSFDALLNETTDTIGSNELVDKKELLGEPLILVQVSFRPSEKASRDYVSVEAIGKTHGYIVFNDGSTGIRRQMLNYCVQKNFARWNDENENYDRNAEELEWEAPATLRFDDNAAVTISVPIRVKVPHGLRLSEYDYTDENNKSRKAETFYLS